MTAIESITLLLCLVVSVVLIAIAWWVAGIHTLLVRLAVGVETRHIERNAERAAEMRRREAWQKHFFQWLAETASTLKGIHRTVEKCAERPDTMVMMNPAPVQADPESEPIPSTGKPSRRLEAASLPTEPTAERLMDSDAETLCWQGPDSGHTLLGVGATEPSEPKHGTARARELAQRLRKPGR